MNKQELAAARARARAARAELKIEVREVFCKITRCILEYDCKKVISPSGDARFDGGE